MIERLLIISAPRHGTTYLCDALNNSITEPKIFMEYETLHDGNYFPIVLENIRRNLNLADSCMDELISLRHSDEKKFLEKISAYYHQVALNCNCRYYGFKIFELHIRSQYIRHNKSDTPLAISNKVTLASMVNYADKIIILNRDGYDVAYSYANSLLTNEWHPRFRDNKVETIEIDERIVTNIINLLKTRRSFFSEAISESINQNKDMLCLEYSEFPSIAWSKISNFLDIKVVEQNPIFFKNDYSSKRDAFFAKYPAIAEAAKRYSFSLDDLREENISIKSTINNS